MKGDALRAWAAGYLEGDGGFTVSDRKAMVSIKRNIADDDAPMPDVLVRFYAAVGRVGRVGGPYHQKNRRWPFRMWYARSEEASAAVMALWPWLTNATRERWVETTKRAERQQARR